ncbi:MAG: helix-turn-helix transcriptional regulator [Hyphomicrobiaceae bacterium]|nr:helix-turn-helix transcriptional regulator [Hyphomicrobiaceae bacterium]MCC0024731.1 helix-turn-helix transcriptional regulator [Hyphomicrobiaceae bacterium]
MARKHRIGNAIRRLRFEHGEMTQQQLADAVGVTRQTIVAMEQSKYSPSLELAFLVADVFGQKVDEVFWLDKEGGE